MLLRRKGDRGRRNVRYPRWVGPNREPGLYHRGVRPLLRVSSRTPWWILSARSAAINSPPTPEVADSIHPLVVARRSMPCERTE